MQLPPKPQYLNGNHRGPPDAGGPSVSSRPQNTAPTEFPDPVPLAGPAAAFYGLHRFHAGGAPLIRWPLVVLGGLAFLWLTGIPPGRWLGVTGWLLLLALVSAAGLVVRRRHYVAFAPSPAPQVNSQPLGPQDKIPVYATGLLSVEGKERSFAFLPGFFRTFATGEHAVLCHAAPRRWLLLGKRPPEELGMWYAFVQPDAITRVEWGKLTFGVTKAPAVAVSYRLETVGKRGRPKVRHETLYLACSTMDDAVRVLQDLHHRLPTGSPVAPIRSQRASP